MATTDYWQKQNKDQPLFPDLLWSRPQNKRHAGKLTVIGGNLHGFAAPAAAFSAAQQAGIGNVAVVLPDAIQKLVSAFLPDAHFAPSTPSGSFGSQSLAELLDTADWSDGVLLAGDVGRNSETTIVLEAFLQKYSGQVTVTQDTVDLFIATPQTLLDRPDTTLVITFSQLQKLAKHASFASAFTSDMGLVRLIEALHDFTKQYPTNVVVSYENHVVVAIDGQVSSSESSAELPVIAAAASVWWLQHPQQPFEALTTSVSAIDHP